MDDVQRWEHRVEKVPSGEALGHLEAMGREGWQLVQWNDRRTTWVSSGNVTCHEVDAVEMFLKRPLAAASPASAARS